MSSFEYKLKTFILFFTKMSVFNQDSLYDLYETKACDEKESLEQLYNQKNTIFQQRQFDSSSSNCHYEPRKEDNVIFSQNTRSMCIDSNNSSVPYHMCHGWECSTHPFTIQPDFCPNTFMNFMTPVNGHLCVNSHRIWNNMTSRKRATCEDVRK